MKDRIMLVDVLQDIVRYVREKSDMETMESTHHCFMREKQWVERKRIVERQLALYCKSRLVITTDCMLRYRAWHWVCRYY